MVTKVAAILATGTAADRAIAVGLAEAGLDIAIATLEKSQEQEFATASIANEVWAVGREQFSSVIDATDPTALAAFAAETADRLGRCDLLVVRPTGTFDSPPDEISPDEWAHALLFGLTVPFLAAHAFAPVIERSGGGSILFLAPEDAGDSVVAAVAAAGRLELAGRLNAAFAGRGVDIVDAGAGITPETVIKLVS
jgi:NAD(P)-dependent dehydrogenase (short-subunit alcohol dehydrogenase family)